MEIALAYNDDGALAAGEADDSIGVEAVLDQVQAVEPADGRMDGLSFPVIVKATWEEGGHGIRVASPAESETAARERARYVAERYAQPALVEEFVGGREFNVSLLGQPGEPRALP